MTHSYKPTYTHTYIIKTEALLFSYYILPSMHNVLFLFRVIESEAKGGKCSDATQGIPSKIPPAIETAHFFKLLLKRESAAWEDIFCCVLDIDSMSHILYFEVICHFFLVDDTNEQREILSSRIAVSSFWCRHTRDGSQWSCYALCIFGSGRYDVLCGLCLSNICISLWHVFLEIVPDERFNYVYWNFINKNSWLR